MTKKLKAALAVAALLAFAIACGAGGDSETAEPDNAAPVTNPVEPDSVTPVTNPVEPDSVTPVTNPVEPDSATPTPKVVWVVPWPDSWPVPAIAGHVAGAREWTDSRISSKLLLAAREWG